MVPAIGVGTWRMGGAAASDTSSDARSIRALRRAVELGMFLIDTAEMYGAGHAEELVGEAVKPFPREHVFIVSKVWSDHMHYDDVIRAAEHSLKRLKMDWIDLYLIHSPSLEVPVRETLKAMERLLAQGLVRFVGVSNFDIGQIEEARGCLSKNGIVANQVGYSLLNRCVERYVLPYCEQHKITVMAYQPLGGDFSRGELSRNGFLWEIGKRYGRTAAQVALNWLVAHEGVIAIPKAVELEHLEENAHATGWQLSSRDMRRLSSLFQHGPADRTASK